MKINLINQSQIPKLLEIETLTNESPWLKNAFEKELSNPWFFGCQSADLQGFVLARQMMDELELFLIAVAPDSQGQGLGNLLMKELVRKALAEKIKQIFLEVRELNKRAIALYEKFGFVKIDVRKNYYKNGDNAWVMRLEICS